jgi:hypothetical protein
MEITINPPKDSVVNIKFNEKQFLNIVKALDKMINYIENNKTLSFRDEKRLLKAEREELIDFHESLKDVEKNYFKIEDK